MKLEQSLTPYTKISSKEIKDLNIQPDIIKFVEENMGRTNFDINHNNIFMDPPPTAMEIKTKIHKWDLIHLESICTAKENQERKEKTSHRRAGNLCQRSK